MTVGIHTGEFMGVPPTGKSVVGRFAAFDRIVDGKIVSSEVFLDVTSILIQVGAMEPPKTLLKCKNTIVLLYLIYRS